MSTASTHEPRTGGQDSTKGRWLLVGAALLLQFAIGAVYAWIPRSRNSGAPDTGQPAIATR